MILIMKVLLLCSAFNGLCQRIHREVSLEGHEVSVELSPNPMVMREHRDRFLPDIIIAPFLKHRIPNDIWLSTICLILHPGVCGDGGPSSIDWAILNRETVWGATLLQANQNLDGGRVWASHNFTLRSSNKSNIYRREITAFASKMINKSLKHYEKFKSSLAFDAGDVSLNSAGWKPYMKQSMREINWSSDSTDDIVRKINSADSSPGLLSSIGGVSCYLFGAQKDRKLSLDAPAGQVLGHREEAICLATRDGSVWIKQLKVSSSSSDDLERSYKLPALRALASYRHLLKIEPISSSLKKEIHSTKTQGIAYLYFNCYNGALNSEQCINFLAEYRQLNQDPDVKVIVLMGGNDFWCNGIHLNCIENANDPAKESWRNINAINLIVEAVITTCDKLTVAALRNNAGAGGAMLALACDYVIARDGVVVNPHYGLMGLPGSEFSTYLLPKKVGKKRAKELLQNCMPIVAREALEIELFDRVFSENWNSFHRQLRNYGRELAEHEDFDILIREKKRVRQQDEQRRALVSYSSRELQAMKKVFNDVDSDYHLLRYRFVHKIVERETPSRLISWNYHDELTRLSS
jgi:putative two-component system hydrogenase maturation factor HypX/HoxX